eukprot:gene13284-4121_t
MDQGERRRSSCGRGVLKFKSWKPLPRPGKRFCESGGQQVNKDKKEAQLPQNNAQKTPNVQAKQGLKIVLAKYSYKANPECPGGFEELSMSQGEKFYFYSLHPSNPHWAKAENMEGRVGFVPTSYIMELQSKPSQLPWFENKRLEIEAEEEKQKNQPGLFGVPNNKSMPPKKYVSAYDAQSSVEASDFSCDLCGKVFNGPKPYRLHMSSKAHKEEVEAQNSR